MEGAVDRDSQKEVSYQWESYVWWKTLFDLREFDSGPMTLWREINAFLITKQNKNGVRWNSGLSQEEQSPVLFMSFSNNAVTYFLAEAKLQNMKWREPCRSTEHVTVAVLSVNGAVRQPPNTTESDCWVRPRDRAAHCLCAHSAPSN